jgi:phosphatidylglycerophosphatase A
MPTTANPARSLNDRLAMIVATGGGAGRIPRVPGTAGSLVAIALYLLLSWLVEQWHPAAFAAWYAAAAVVLGLVGVWAASSAARQLGAHDPQVVVIDEISGQWLALAPVAAGMSGAANWLDLLLAFLLFRAFDIWKPPPVRRAERLPGGWGIMADDWLAGMYAAVVFWLLRLAGW